MIRETTEKRLRFSRRFGNGSAGHLTATDVGGCLVRPLWVQESGLTLVVARRAVTATAAELTGSVATVDVVALGDFVPHLAVLESEGEDAREANLSPTGLGTYRIRVDLEDLRGAAGSVPAAEAGSPDRRWYLAVLDHDGRSRRVHWSGENARGNDLSFPLDPAWPTGKRQAVWCASTSRRLWVAVEGGPQPSLTVLGRWYGSEATPKELMLQGSRVKVPAGELVVEGDCFRAIFGLRHREHWADSSNPYDRAAISCLLRADQLCKRPRHCLNDLPEAVTTTTHQVRMEVGRDARFLLTVAAPGRCPKPVPIRSACWRTCMETPGSTRRTPSSSAATTEAARSTRLGAIHDELARRRPDLTRYWVVADGFLEVPPGPCRLLIRTRQWWTVLPVRVLVTNCWLPGQFRRRPHQTVQQTWHGRRTRRWGWTGSGAERSGYAAKMRVKSRCGASSSRRTGTALTSSAPRTDSPDRCWRSAIRATTR